MRRWSTWLVAGAVVALAAVAAADALRPGLEDHEGGAQEVSQPEPRTDEPRGLLAAAEADCSNAALLLLPEAIELEPRRAVDCNGAVWSADHTLTANCADGFTTVAGLDWGTVLRLRGCSPAWRPDGAVSILDDGDVILARRRGRPQVFITREQLADELDDLEDGREYELVELAWHGAVAFAGIVAGPEPTQRAVVYYTPEGVTAVFPQLGHDISRIRVSPLGNMVAFLRDGEIVVLDPSGDEVEIPRIAGVRAIAWSEDERWTALATRTETVIARTASGEVTMRFAVGGDTLEWREPAP
jgi:hypothetical protein